MDYGRLKSTGKVFPASEAKRGRQYVCPTCGLPLELRRGHDLEYFAHWRGLQGTRECELFVLTDDADNARSSSSSAQEARGQREVAVEDQPLDLGVVLGEIDGRWGLGLRLPEIPAEELVDTGLGLLRSAFVDVFAGSERLVRVSALELRPGVGAGRVDVPPRVQQLRAQTAGNWPRTVDRERWNLSARALDRNGTLFRFRHGEWTRLLADSGVHFGEALLVLGELQSPPPVQIAPQLLSQLSDRDMQWGIWEVRLPDDADSAVSVWLGRLGHDFVERAWSVTLAAAPRSYSQEGEPVFWAGDAAVLAIDRPHARAEAQANFRTDANAYSGVVRNGERQTSHVSVTARIDGRTCFEILDARRPRLDLHFVEKPSQSALLELLAQVPRLRVWVDEECLVAWEGSPHTVRMEPRAKPRVRVEFGDESARARITVWADGKRRFYRGLSSGEAASILESALQTASRVELDADNLGRIELAPLHISSHPRGSVVADERLAWRDQVLSSHVQPSGLTTPTFVAGPRMPRTLVARSVDSAALVRARLTLRRRRSERGAPR